MENQAVEIKRKGWWANHEYRRRKVEDIEEFIGWLYLLNLTEKIEARFGFEKAALGAYLMEGGFRIGELVFKSDGKAFGGLYKHQLIIMEKQGMIAFRQVQRLKGYEKTGMYFESIQEDELPTNKLRRLFAKDIRTGLFMRKRFETKPVIQMRSFAFPDDEPLVKMMLAHWKEAPEDRPLFPFTATRAYQIFTRIDPNIWNHWFRSQRASQLVAEYNFDDRQLMRFFEWKDEKTARRYGRRGVGDVMKMFPSKDQVSRVWEPIKLQAEV